jgi:hypothetical protein
LRRAPILGEHALIDSRLLLGVNLTPQAARAGLEHGVSELVPVHPKGPAQVVPSGRAV